MASNITKVPLFRVAATRSYSAKAVPVGGVKDYDIKTQVLSSKLVIATAANDSQIARVALCFKAGTRYETPDNYGSTHVLRIAAGLSTKNSSQFAIVRNLQEVGATLTCAVDREIISYTLESTRWGLERCLPYLAQVATEQCFKPWEISDNVPRLKLELATRTQQARVIDLLHKAAFRRQGLGNSIYISKHSLAKISSETLQHYVTNNFAANRAALVSLGADECVVKDFADCLNLRTAKDPSQATCYAGSEIRHDKGGALAHIAVAAEGASLKDPKEALAFAILQRVLGTGSPIKRGKQSRGLLGQTVGRSSEPTAVTALNVSYADTGLFGVLISTPSRNAGHLLKDVVGILKGGNVPDEDFNRAKNQLKADILLGLEDGNTSIEDIGSQAVLLGSVANACQIVKVIEGICPADVAAAAKKVAASNLSLAARGNLSCLPYLDELV